MATEVLAITDQERQEIRGAGSQLHNLARTHRVTDQATYDAAGGWLKQIKAAQKALTDKKMAVVRPINQALAAARELFRAPEAALEEAENLFKRSMISYTDEQERLRREEQRQAEDAARKERERLEAEARAREQRAAELRAKGNEKAAEKQEAKADQARDVAAGVVAPVIQREPVRTAGVATRENWSAVVTSLEELVKAIAGVDELKGRVPLQAVCPDMKFLNNQARAMKKELNYPGVRPARETILAAGSK